MGTALWASIAWLIAAAGCGTGNDREPVAVPTMPAPPPPLNAPEAPTGVRVSDRGQNFVVWTWDPVEGATAYEGHAFLESEPDDVTRFQTRGLTYRYEGLRAGELASLALRAVRETPAGRVHGPWAERSSVYTLQPTPGPLAACGDQRDQALAYSFSGFPLVVQEWKPGRPIRFRVDAAAIIAGSMRIGQPEFLEDEVLQPLRDMARRLEERLGYPVMASPDAGPGGADHTVTVQWRNVVYGAGWARNCPDIGTPWNAQASPPAVFMNRHIFDPDIACPYFTLHRDNHTIVHELAHVFGMVHWGTYVGPHYLAMSKSLTRMVDGESEVFLKVEDLDNLGCVFPHPDFPRE